MLDEKNLDALFSPNPVYTKIRDDNPTRYINSAKVKNCVLMQDTVVEAGARWEYVISDKNVTVRLAQISFGMMQGNTPYISYKK